MFLVSFSFFIVIPITIVNQIVFLFFIYFKFLNFIIFENFSWILSVRPEQSFPIYILKNMTILQQRVWHQKTRKLTLNLLSIFWKTMRIPRTAVNQQLTKHTTLLLLFFLRVKLHCLWSRIIFEGTFLLARISLPAILLQRAPRSRVQRNVAQLLRKLYWPQFSPDYKIINYNNKHGRVWWIVRRVCQFFTNRANNPR